MRQSDSPGPRRYPISRSERYALAEAALAADLPPHLLRRAIILGDLEAEPVADRRDYIVRGCDLQEFIRTLRPGERAEFAQEYEIWWSLGMFLAIPLIAILLCSIPAATAAPSESGHRAARHGPSESPQPTSRGPIRCKAPWDPWSPEAPSKPLLPEPWD